MLHGMETSPEQPHRRRQHRHLFPVAPETRVPSPDPFNLAEPESLDEYARRQTELFRHLIPHVGSSEALWALESDPVPDDPFDWSVVADQDRPFVA